MIFMSPQPVAAVEVAVKAEADEIREADERRGGVVVPFELSARDREDYFRAVFDPPPPPNALKSAVAEYRKFFAR
jgi:hypothetical protein